MKPKVYQAVRQFEQEVKTHYPQVKLELIEPMGGADATFRTIFPTLNWVKGLGQLDDIVLDIEEETGVWISILPEGADLAAPDP
jgi:hypothetical protein